MISYLDKNFYSYIEVIVMNRKHDERRRLADTYRREVAPDFRY